VGAVTVAEARREIIGAIRRVDPTDIPAAVGPDT